MSSVLTFLKEVRVELSKITWPTREELIGSTIIVLILVAFFATFLGVSDLGFSLLIKKLFNVW
ncbi:TPA: preprotein translocase subunit SecE [Candidatus Dependentiae bacterium]|nr:MAG: Preprotein translocase, SecE subunit [candidate division TM6 bacterium GW2011_GWE2_31_21]KKP54042.1 MAG: Preprotein translocase, SecE subunit [candidate division TM6 bacterium GW2011_GWF2_33_332]HBS48375.1 preprotein translocase subunit SecE [Candidatus Dependentiae bacterium]HBZ72951.1 preprotein translocase subunit SecE [Candidatus Dependentiae bacterium]